MRNWSPLDIINNFWGNKQRKYGLAGDNWLRRKLSNVWVMGGGHLNWLDLIFNGVLSMNALSPDSVPLYYSTVGFLADLFPTLLEPMLNKLSRSTIIWLTKFTTIILLEYGIHRD